MRMSPKRFAVLIGSTSLLLAIAGLMAWRIGTTLSQAIRVGA